MCARTHLGRGMCGEESQQELENLWELTLSSHPVASGMEINLPGLEASTFAYVGISTAP